MQATRILIISSDAGAGAEFARALSQRGLAVETARGMAEALQRAGQQAVDIVLAEMPASVADDPWSVEHLRSAWPKAEIFIFIDKGMEGMAEQTAVLDVRGFLTRPLAPASVADLLGLEAPAARGAEPLSRKPGVSRVSRMARNIGLFLAAPFTATFYTLALPFVAAYVFGRSAWETLKNKRASG